MSSTGDRPRPCAASEPASSSTISLGSGTPVLSAPSQSSTKRYTTTAGMVPSPCNNWSMDLASLQCLLEVFQNVRHVFQPHRNAHHAVGNARRRTVRSCEPPVRDGGGMADQGVGVAQARSTQRQPQLVD